MRGKQNIIQDERKYNGYRGSERWIDWLLHKGTSDCKKLAEHRP